ncbi:MAG: hypothetical protein ACFB3T_07160 [Geminicoccaceae bacterium]
MTTRTVLCMKWGTRYGPEFVNRLYRSVYRHLDAGFRFVCLTDDASGLEAGIEPLPIPDLPIPPPFENQPWRKLVVWADRLHDLSGPCLVLDLDIVITGDLAPFFTFEPGRFCVIHNWTQPTKRIGNTSVFRLEIGGHPYILERYLADPAAIHAGWRIEQQYISETISDMVFWPDAWVRTFKLHCLPNMPMRLWQTPSLPDDAKIIAFPGHPDPDEALAGCWPAPWYKKIYKTVRPTPWIGDHWR